MVESNNGVRIKSSFKIEVFMAMVSQIKPKSINESLSNEDWILAGGRTKSVYLK